MDGSLITFYTDHNYLDCDLCDVNMDRVLEDAPVFKGHSLFNKPKLVAFAFIVQSFFDGPDSNQIIPALDLTRKRSRLSVDTCQISRL